MKTIEKNVINEIIINKSRFICQIIKVNTVDEIKLEIDKIKVKYKDATHYCFAYKIGNVKRFNDDGEPGGTAGMPILNVIESNDLDHILFVVIRYFGGIKLGAGGLVRAYTKSCTEALNSSSIKDLIETYKVEISYDYTNAKLIDYILSQADIINKTFDTIITCTFLTPVDGFNKLLPSFEDICLHISIIDKMYI